jgi:hypothetical protein
MARLPRPILPAGTIYGQPPAVRVGVYGQPGNLIGRIEAPTGGRVMYRIDSIILKGTGNAAHIATARAAHREMIMLAAEEAQRNGQLQFVLRGIQANVNFRAHADKLALEVGVLNSGRSIQGIPGAHPDYEVTLDVVKVLGGP